MMNQPQFRIWLSGDKKMLYGWPWEMGSVRASDNMISGDYEDYHPTPENLPITMEKIPCKGDVNKNSIYECDILYDTIGKHRYLVMWDRYELKVDFIPFGEPDVFVERYKLCRTESRMRVVGNLYEHDDNDFDLSEYREVG